MSTAKEHKPHIETIDAEYRFSDGEKLELAQRLAHHNTQFSELEDRKKTIASEMKGQIELAQANINSLSTKITNGYELRPTDCVVSFDAKSNTKHYHHARTGAYLRSAEMTKADYQMS